MKAMLLAAGRGERLRPLTDTVPKPLIEIAGRALIEHHVLRLVGAGITDIVVNHARLGARIEARLGDGSRYGAHIHYSAEGEELLETGGGIQRALAHLAPGAFALISADVWTDYPYARLPPAPDGLAHLVLVPNPPHHPDGDFALVEQRVRVDAAPRHTYSGIAVLRPELFDECPGGRFALAPLLRHAASQSLVTGELFTGDWVDVGTPERLRELVERVR